MKTIPAAPAARPAPTESSIREYAYHLYELRGRAPGLDVADWLEASACLNAHPAGSGAPAFAPVAEPPRHGAPAKGKVHAAVGHGRTVQESTAHTSGLRNA